MIFHKTRKCLCCEGLGVSIACSRRQSLTVLLLACSETSPSPQFQCSSQYGAHVTGRFSVNIEVGGGRGLVLKRMVQTMLKLVSSHEPIFRVASKTESMGHISVPPLLQPSLLCMSASCSSDERSCSCSLKQVYHACTGLWFRPSWACGARLIFSFALRVAAKIQSVAFTF